MASSSAHRSSGTGVAQRRAFSATSSAVRTLSGTDTTAGWRSGKLHRHVGQRLARTAR